MNLVPQDSLSPPQENNLILPADNGQGHNAGTSAAHYTNENVQQTNNLLTPPINNVIPPSEGGTVAKDSKVLGLTDKAWALYTYTASPDDPKEMSFSEDEILDILDKSGEWWVARKKDGTVGIVPSNYLQSIGDANALEGKGYTYQARALYTYTPSPDNPKDVSFSEGEILDILDKNGNWWRAQKRDGTVGVVPSNYMQLVGCTNANSLRDTGDTYDALAIYAYTASPDDPKEISFLQGETLNVFDKSGEWWLVQKKDGTVGIAPSNYLQLL
ncbi:Cytoplasmic protein nck2 [Ceratobasidium sp. 394]|nr:Cytoplasmic protein nck2 [Ceratobasidium sp. 394]